MNTSVSKSLLTACFLLLPASLVHAAPEAALKVTMNGYFQSNVSNSTKFLRGKVGRARISTKQILKLISQDSHRSIPAGSQIIVKEDGSTEVVDRNGNLILDSSEYVQVRYYTESEIIDGVRNLDNGKEKSRSYFKISLALNLSGFTGTVSGMAIAQNLITEPDKDGVQKWRVNTQSQVNGRGEIKGGPGFYDGKIKLNGRGASIQ
jgi:hypothetical protein